MACFILLTYERCHPPLCGTQCTCWSTVWVASSISPRSHSIPSRVSPESHVSVPQTAVSLQTTCALAWRMVGLERDGVPWGCVRQALASGNRQGGVDEVKIRVRERGEACARLPFVAHFSPAAEQVLHPGHHTEGVQRQAREGGGGDTLGIQPCQSVRLK